MPITHSPSREQIERPFQMPGRNNIHDREGPTSEIPRTPGGSYKKRKPNSPITEDNPYNRLLDKIMTIENDMKELTTFVHTNINKPDHQTNSNRETNVDKENGTAIHNFDHYTRKEREAFYAIYGKLKEVKIKYTKEDLNKKLPIEEFNIFREWRNKLTFWVKLGLGISRQLEELKLPINKTVPKPPLLTTRHMARLFEIQTETYLEEIARVRLTFYEPMFLETKKLLTQLNTEIMDLISEADTNNREIVLVKAFRSAVAGSNELFKSNYRNFTQPGNANPPEPEAATYHNNQNNFRPRKQSYRPLLNIGLPILRGDELRPPRQTTNPNEQTVSYTREVTETNNIEMETDTVTGANLPNPTGTEPKVDAAEQTETNREPTEPGVQRTESLPMDPPSTGSSGRTLSQAITETLRPRSVSHTSRPTTASAPGPRRRGLSPSPSPSPSPKTRYTVAEIRQRDVATYNAYLSSKQMTPNPRSANKTATPSATNREY